MTGREFRERGSGGVVACCLKSLSADGALGFREGRGENAPPRERWRAVDGGLEIAREVGRESVGGAVDPVLFVLVASAEVVVIGVAG
jgi:hypothetical protein